MCLGSNRLIFQQYNSKELAEILTSRLAETGVFETPAIQFASQTVAKISGDARRALDICRRAVENVEARHANAKGSSTVKVTIKDLQAVQKTISASGPAIWIQSATLHQKIMLLALSRCIRKQGLTDTAFEEVSRIS